MLGEFIKIFCTGPQYQKCHHKHQYILFFQTKCVCMRVRNSTLSENETIGGHQYVCTIFLKKINF